MPTSTFFNLPDDKRERFVSEALEEFARHPYDQASVSAVVDRLGIAKGSVYQYFDDKYDLFRWLIEEGGRRKMAWLEGHPPPQGIDLFDRLRHMYRIGMEFLRAEPLWNRLLLRALEPSREERVEETRREQFRASHAFLRDLLQSAKDAGDLRADADPDVLAHLVGALLREGLMAAFLDQAGIDLSTLPDDPEAVARVSDERLLGVADQAVDLLEHGLASD